MFRQLHLKNEFDKVNVVLNIIIQIIFTYIITKIDTYLLKQD